MRDGETDEVVARSVKGCIGFSEETVDTSEISETVGRGLVDSRC